MIQQELQKRELFKRNVLMTPTRQELSTEPTRQVGVYEYNALQLRHAKSVKISTSVLSALGPKSA